MKITRSRLKELVRQSIKEIDFKDQAAFDAYNKKHKMRKSTKVNVGGKDTTAGDAGKKGKDDEHMFNVFVNGHEKPMKIKAKDEKSAKHQAHQKIQNPNVKLKAEPAGVGGPSHANVPTKKKGTSKPAFKKPSDMGDGQGQMSMDYDEPTHADDVESNWDKSAKGFDSIADKYGVEVHDESDWSGIDNNPQGEYAFYGKNSEDPGDGFSVYSTVETGRDGETYEGNRNIIAFPEDDSSFGGQVEVEFNSIEDAQKAMNKILSNKQIKAALDGGRATMAKAKDLIKKELEKLGGRGSKNESVNESVKRRRFTVKEVQRWMKTLEENRYKKVYNSDCRRVSWMANNMNEDVTNMPISMRKKWTKAQYGRERYLAKEFLKAKTGEQKLRESIRGIIKNLLSEENLTEATSEISISLDDFDKVKKLIKPKPKQIVKHPFSKKTFGLKVDKKQYDKTLEILMKKRINVQG